MKKYIVVTPLKRASDIAGKVVETVLPGKAIELEDEDAQPLLDCGAIREPDIIENDEAGLPEKKAAAKK